MKNKIFKVKHFLDIYRLRLSMSEKGVTKPEKNIVKFMKTFVANLFILDPEDLIDVDRNQKCTKFIHKNSGKVLGELPKDVKI